METNLFTREENISFWKNLFLVAVFFIITPVTLGISLFSLISLRSSALSAESLPQESLIISPRSGIQVYASLPVEQPSVSAEIGATDARPEIVRQYLEYWGSPLVPYSPLIVSTADKYSLDFRLITAIAQQESNLCKIIPPGSYNCWGWGIHSRGSLGFSSFDEGIEIVSKGLRDEYLNKGYTTIEDIMSKYTPLSNGSWANGVNKFLSEMQ